MKVKIIKEAINDNELGVYVDRLNNVLKADFAKYGGYYSFIPYKQGFGIAPGSLAKGQAFRIYIELLGYESSVDRSKFQYNVYYQNTNGRSYVQENGVDIVPPRNLYFTTPLNELIDNPNDEEEGTFVTDYILRPLEIIKNSLTYSNVKTEDLEDDGKITLNEADGDFDVPEKGKGVLARAIQARKDKKQQKKDAAAAIDATATQTRDISEAVADALKRRVDEFIDPAFADVQVRTNTGSDGKTVVMLNCNCLKQYLYGVEVTTNHTILTTGKVYTIVKGNDSVPQNVRIFDTIQLICKKLLNVDISQSGEFINTKKFLGETPSQQFKLAIKHPEHVKVTTAKAEYRIAEAVPLFIYPENGYRFTSVPVASSEQLQNPIIFKQVKDADQDQTYGTAFKMPSRNTTVLINVEVEAIPEPEPESEPEEAPKTEEEPKQEEPKAPEETSKAPEEETAPTPENPPEEAPTEPAKADRTGTDFGNFIKTQHEKYQAATDPNEKLQIFVDTLNILADKAAKMDPIKQDKLLNELRGVWAHGRKPKPKNTNNGNSTTTT